MFTKEALLYVTVEKSCKQRATLSVILVVTGVSNTFDCIIVFVCHTGVFVKYSFSCSLMVEFSFIVVIDRLQQLQLCAYKDLCVLNDDINNTIK